MIDIEDNVPLPSDGWVSNKHLPPKTIAFTNADVKDGWVKQLYEAAYNPQQPGPNDCTFIGGPLNGKFGPLRDNAPKVVEIEIYNDDGSVRSVELYALNDAHPTPTFRVHVGTKLP